MPLHKSTWLTSLLIVACVAALAPVAAYSLLANTVSAQDDATISGAASAMLRADQRADGPTTGQIRYQFAWDWGRAIPDESGQGWRVTTMLGYQVHVTQGYVVLGSAQLVPCAHAHPAQQSRILTVLAEQFMPAVAQAGHGDASDRSQIGQPLVESFAAPEITTAAAQFGDEPTYCQLHYLASYASENAANMPVDVDMVGRTLYLTGTYVAPDASAPTPFSISSNLAWGGMINLTLGADLTRAVELANTVDAQVTLQRTLGDLFDLVDFASMTESDAARMILRSLTISANAAVRMGN